MASAPISVELVEGGKGLVFPGDPAYDYCRELQKKGYTTLYLGLLTLMGGRPTRRYRMDDDMADDMIRVLAAEDQAEMVEESRPCTHHWMLGPTDFETHKTEGVCKVCGETRSFKTHFAVNYKGGKVSTPAERSAIARSRADWQERYHAAVELTGQKAKAA